MSRFLRLAMLCTFLRWEEKALLSAASARGLGLNTLLDRDFHAPLSTERGSWDGLLLRSVSHFRSYYAAKALDGNGTVVVNGDPVIANCGDKAITSALLAKAGVPTPECFIALDVEGALKALARVGYPAVLKPTVGSWGRLIARVRDEEEARQILEHKASMANPLHSVFYVQEYVEKPGRDIRVVVAGDRAVASMYRHGEDWVTNVSRGGKGRLLEPGANPEVEEVALAAAGAVGGGVLGVDILESGNRLLVNEVNHTPEFRGLTDATGADVAGAILEYFVEAVRG